LRELFFGRPEIALYNQQRGERFGGLALYDRGGPVEQGKTKQRVDELHFYFYQRALHPELFRIHQVKHVEQRLYHAEVWVVGLSHVVTVQFGDNTLTELIAHESELLPKNGLATSFRLRGERDHSQSFANGLRFILSSQVEKMTANLFPSAHRDLMRYAQTRGMYQVFDEWEYDGLTPFTFVDFEAREREFHVHAFHAFPQELTLLKTQSIFELARSERERYR